MNPHPLIVQADARQIPLPDRYVQCVVTSPPYWGLRDYGHSGQIGLEPSPDAYVQSLVSVFREVWRVLRDDGTVWLNLGDSYAANRSYQVADNKHVDVGNSKASQVPEGLKPKDLVGIPWRVAFALQADGWYLRSDIIWSKPNPMPESVTDRPTKAHEYLFLLAKSERYYYDHEAVKEQSSEPDRGPRKDRFGGTKHNATKHSDQAEWLGDVSSGRNRRSVWTITPKPYRGAHFATFPPELVEPCILAGTPEGGCCCMCGAPFRRVIEKGQPRIEQQLACGSAADGTYGGVAQKDYDSAHAQDPSATKARILAGMVERRTIGWKLSCTCSPTAAAASIVLDPFAGSGTTGMVAKRLGRIAVLLDIKPDYLQMAKERCW